MSAINLSANSPEENFAQYFMDFSNENKIFGDIILVTENINQIEQNYMQQAKNKMQEKLKLNNNLKSKLNELTQKSAQMQQIINNITFDNKENENLEKEDKEYTAMLNECKELMAANEKKMKDKFELKRARTEKLLAIKNKVKFYKALTRTAFKKNFDKNLNESGFVGFYSAEDESARPIIISKDERKNYADAIWKKISEEY